MSVSADNRHQAEANRVELGHDDRLLVLNVSRSALAEDDGEHLRDKGAGDAMRQEAARQPFPAHRLRK